MKLVELNYEIKLVELAFIYSKLKHLNEKRKDGEDYFNHVFRTAEIIEKVSTPKEKSTLVIVALLHDTIENTSATYEEVKELFGATIANLVQEVTSDKDTQRKVGKDKYLTNKMLNMSDNALLVKLADRLDNVSSLTNVTPTFKEKYTNETSYILDNLSTKRKLTTQQNTLVEKISKEVDNQKQSLKNIQKSYQ